MQKGEGSKRLGTNTTRRRRLTGPKWVQAGRPSPFRGPACHSFDLDASRAIYSPLIKSHVGINSSSVAEEQRSLRDTISEMRVVIVV
jgi:hypothetical protein